ncbi:MAG: molybdopterin-dependent oxidoreductase [Gammaproteobacteria bacterium]|nr:molybdopterin-dependent oxidoreductase [Gammaproteobacteria bacterium]
MKSVTVNRRNFLKMLGWGGAGTALTGCDLPTTVTLEEGKEEVVSYFMPEEYAIPGIGVWYATTCTQCEAACGLHGRVREGRVLKLEGNPESSVNQGRACMMGQAGLQAHYNPDRVTSPMLRKGGSLQAVSWNEAMAELGNRLKSVTGDRFALVTGTVSGHQSVLTAALMSEMGSSNHFAHETINTAVWQQVCQDMLGDAHARLRMDKAQCVLSFGADFLGTWMSPVHMAGEYAKFRSGQRGTLIQVEPKMTLTGGNADLWVAAKPGTEGVLALGIANFIVDRGWNKAEVPAAVRASLATYTLPRVQEITGVEPAKIKRIASLLSERAPSLVLAGESATGYEHGYDTAASAMLLNIILGSVGTTVVGSTAFPEKGMRANAGNTSSLVKFANGLQNKAYDVVVFANTNPAFTAPAALKLREGLAGVGFKVAITMFPDETSMEADLVLPLSSSLEDWGTHVSAYQGADKALMSVQQPLMEPLHKDTRGFGDILLGMLKARGEKYAQFADYYAFLQASLKNMPAGVTSISNEAAWNALFQKGVIEAAGSAGSLSPRIASVKAGKVEESKDYPMHLVPSARLGLWDGRHANLPWLQEAPDQIAKVVWDSWAEMHPKTAAKLGVKNGDFVNITSASGAVKTQVYVHKGVHPEAIAVPMGQGHSAYGRYAKGRGVNPLSILNPLVDATTGELATHATRVKVAKAHEHQVLVKMGSSETQLGRSLVRTVSADVLRRTEGEA